MRFRLPRRSPLTIALTMMGVPFTCALSAELPPLPRVDAPVKLEVPSEVGMPRLLRLAIHYPGGRLDRVGPRSGLMLSLHNWGGQGCAGSADPEKLAQRYDVVAICVDYFQSGPWVPERAAKPYDHGFVQALDALRALSYVYHQLDLERRAFDRERIYAVGGSGGGNVALMANKLAPRTFAAVVSLSGMAKLSDDVAFGAPYGSRLNAGYSAIPSSARYLTVDAQELRFIGHPAHLHVMQRLGNRAKVVLIHGAADDVCPTHEVRELVGEFKTSGIDVSARFVSTDDVDGTLFKNPEHGIGDRTQILFHVADEWLLPRQEFDAKADDRAQRGARIRPNDFDLPDAPVVYPTTQGRYVISFKSRFPTARFEFSRPRPAGATRLPPPQADVEAASFRVSAFKADVTPPLGHALHAGAITAAREIVDRLEARGLVLLGAGEPIVIVAIDWLEIRNDAHERWRQAVADAASTTRARVLVSSVHQHDAPLADLTAQRLLDEHAPGVQIIDLEFHERAVERVANAVRDSLSHALPVTHFGVGRARVEQIASNRRVVDADDRVTFSRGSSSGGDASLRDAPEGEVDPWLRTLSFWNGSAPVAALHVFASHPMSYYGRGGVSYDFVGMARARRQADQPRVHQVYFSGCAGDVTAGKYNDGSPANRAILARRLYAAMCRAWNRTELSPLEQIAWRSIPLRLEPRRGPGFSLAEMEARLRDDTARPFDRALAAMGLSWRKRVDTGVPLDVPVVDFGRARIVLMPAETFVGYQLRAQRLRPELFLFMIGYGECAPGYIPTAARTRERFNETHSWLWVAPESEAAMLGAIEAAVQ